MRTREGSRGLQLKQGVFVSTATPLRGFRSPSGVVSKPISGHSFDFFENLFSGLETLVDDYSKLTRSRVKFLRAWLSKQKPLASTGAHVSPL